MKSFWSLARLLCILALFICSASLYAQQKDKQSYFHISIGPSFPLGKYATGDDYTRKQGMATTGGMIKLSGSKLLKKTFGLSASIQYQINPLNSDDLEKNIWKTGYWEYGTFMYTDTGISISTEPPPRTSPYNNWEVDKASWHVGSLMVGGFKQIPIGASNQWSACVEADLGFTYAWSPTIRARSVSDTFTVRQVQHKNSGAGFSYSLGTSLSYALNKLTNLRFSVDYFGTSKIRFRDVKTVGYGGDDSNLLYTRWVSSHTRDGKIAISSINIGLGLSFRL